MGTIYRPFVHKEAGEMEGGEYGMAKCRLCTGLPNVMSNELDAY